MKPFPPVNTEDLLEITYVLGRYTSLYDKHMDYYEARWYYQRLAKDFDDIKKEREKITNARKSRRNR